MRNEEKAQWISHYIRRETAGARKPVEDTATAVQQEHKDTRKAENAGLTHREPKYTFQEMMIAISDSLSDHASSNDEDDGDDEDDEETVLGQVSKDDEPGWVMGTITKTVQRCMERFQENQIKLDQLTPLGWEDAADNFRERDMKYSTSE